MLYVSGISIIVQDSYLVSTARIRKWRIHGFLDLSWKRFGLIVSRNFCRKSTKHNAVVRKQVERGLEKVNWIMNTKFCYLILCFRQGDKKKDSVIFLYLLKWLKRNILRPRLFDPLFQVLRYLIINGTNLFIQPYPPTSLQLRHLKNIIRNLWNIIRFL